MPASRLSGKGELIRKKGALWEVYLTEAFEKPCEWKNAHLRKAGGRQYIYRGIFHGKKAVFFFVSKFVNLYTFTCNLVRRNDWKQIFQVFFFLLN